MFWKVSEGSLPCQCRFYEVFGKWDVSPQILPIPVAAGCSTRAVAVGGNLWKPTFSIDDVFS